MAPTELLENVKKRFLPLPIENKMDLPETLLVKALTAYHDRAGIRRGCALALVREKCQ